MSEAIRSRELLHAQELAANLFSKIESLSLIRPGRTELEVNQDICDLAARDFGVTRHWHKRIVRAGRNTLAPYDENPPNLTLAGDDIVFLDFGPIFAEWEADFGRTYVLGDDPGKCKLRDDVARAFVAGKRYFEATPDITGAALFAYVEKLAHEAGWQWGGAIAGHVVGEFPHERIEGDKHTLYVHPENHAPLRGLDELGRTRHWILEIHFVDRTRAIGGFYEELLTL